MKQYSQMKKYFNGEVMKIFYMLATLFLSLGCHSSEVGGLNSEWIEGEGLAHKSDVNLDGVNDSIVYFYNSKVPSKIKLVLSVSKEGAYEILSTPEINNFGCGGSCWVYDLYFKSGSLFLAVNEKIGDGSFSTRYQFKEKANQWVLIGFKNTYTRRESDEDVESGSGSEIGEVVKDVNWLTGNYIKTTKYTDLRVENAKKKIPTKAVLFKDFDFELGVDID